MKFSRSFRIVVGVLCVAVAGALLSSAAGAVSSPQGNWTVDSLLKQLDTQAGSFRSLTADLERTKVTVVVNDRSTQSGQIFVRSDGKMRIEITQPDPQTILGFAHVESGPLVRSSYHAKRQTEQAMSPQQLIGEVQPKASRAH